MESAFANGGRNNGLGQLEMGQGQTGAASGGGSYFMQNNMANHNTNNFNNGFQHPDNARRILGSLIPVTSGGFCNTDPEHFNNVVGNQPNVQMQGNRGQENRGQQQNQHQYFQHEPQNLAQNQFLNMHHQNALQQMFSDMAISNGPAQAQVAAAYASNMADIKNRGNGNMFKSPVQNHHARNCIGSNALPIPTFPTAGVNSGRIQKPQYISSKCKVSLSPPARILAYNHAKKAYEYECVFCKGNNQEEKVYKSHPIRLNDIIVCPYLREHKCNICGATGDFAHTLKYCPYNHRGFFAQPAGRNSLQSAASAASASRSQFSQFAALSDIPAFSSPPKVNRVLIPQIPNRVHHHVHEITPKKDVVRRLNFDMPINASKSAEFFLKNLAQLKKFNDNNLTQ